MLTKKIKILAKYLNFANVFFEKKNFGVIENNQVQLIFYPTIK